MRTATGTLVAAALTGALSPRVSADFREPELASLAALAPYQASGNAVFERWSGLFEDEQPTRLIPEAIAKPLTAKLPMLY